MESMLSAHSQLYITWENYVYAEMSPQSAQKKFVSNIHPDDDFFFLILMHFFFF